jgi:hypothetical protein
MPLFATAGKILLLTRKTPGRVKTSVLGGTMISRGAIAESTPHILHIRPKALAKFSMDRPGRAWTSVLGGTMISSGAFSAITPHFLSRGPEALAQFSLEIPERETTSVLGGT